MASSLTPDITSDFTQGDDRIDLNALGFLSIESSATLTSGYLGIYSVGTDTLLIDGAGLLYGSLATIYSTMLTSYSDPTHRRVYFLQ